MGPEGGLSCMELFREYVRKREALKSVSSGCWRFKFPASLSEISCQPFAPYLISLRASPYRTINRQFFTFVRITEARSCLCPLWSDNFHSVISLSTYICLCHIHGFFFNSHVNFFYFLFYYSTSALSSFSALHSSLLYVYKINWITLRPVIPVVTLWISQLLCHGHLLPCNLTCVWATSEQLCYSATLFISLPVLSVSQSTFWARYSPNYSNYSLPSGILIQLNLKLKSWSEVKGKVKVLDYSHKPSETACLITLHE